MIKQMETHHCNKNQSTHTAEKDVRRRNADGSGRGRARGSQRETKGARDGDVAGEGTENVRSRNQRRS